MIDKQNDIFVCGDTHGTYDIKKINKWYNKNNQKISENDILVQLGDWAGLWYTKDEPRKYKKDCELHLKWAKKKFQLLVVPGNHENYDLINNLEEKEIFGGKVKVLKPFNVYNKQKQYKEIYLLNRGEIYTINGNKILAIGSAKTNDKSTRIQGQSWWKEEELSNEDKENTLKNLEIHNWEVDFVLTHTCPQKVGNKILKLSNYKLGEKEYHRLNSKTKDETSIFFDFLIEKGLKFKEWHFGHWHLDKEYIVDDNKFFCHYNKEPKKIN